MSGLNKVLLAATATVIIAYASAQWQPSRMNGFGNTPSRLGNNQYAPSQQTPSQQSTHQQWNNQPVQHQQQWNGNQQRQHQRQSNLVDYPFTVEFVDRSRPQSGDGGKDENLIDYPFTVEYVSNMNHLSENQENRPQASLHSNQDSFQLRSQQQPYQQNHHHQFSANHNNGDWRRAGNPGSSNFGGSW